MMKFSCYFWKCGRNCGYKFVCWEYDSIFLLYGYAYVYWICNVLVTFCFSNCIDFPCWHFKRLYTMYCLWDVNFLTNCCQGIQIHYISFAKNIMTKIGRNSFGSSDDFGFLFHQNFINFFFNATSHHMVEFSCWF
jgi:hypothetical protein